MPGRRRNTGGAGLRGGGSDDSTTTTIDSVLDVFRSPQAALPLQRADVGALVQSLADDMAELGQRVSAECVPAVAAVDAAALRRVLGT